MFYSVVHRNTERWIPKRKGKSLKRPPFKDISTFWAKETPVKTLVEIPEGTRYLDSCSNGPNSIHGKCSSNVCPQTLSLFVGVGKKNIIHSNLTYWLDYMKTYVLRAKPAEKIIVDLANPPVKIPNRYHLNGLATIKDPVSKHRLLFPSLFIMGQMQHLVK